MTTAFELRQLGIDFEHYAAAADPETTSNIAGGLWLPASVDLAGDPERSYRILETSYREFSRLSALGFGVRKMRYFQVSSDPMTEDYTPFSLEDLSRRELLPPIIRHIRLPIEGVKMGGKEFQTFLIDTPIYIKSLTEQVESEGEILARKFAGEQELAREFGQGSLIFNCTGLGSATLFNDPLVVPIRGQLVLISRTEALPPSETDFMIGGTGFYLFPRKNELVLGGTRELGEWEVLTSPLVGKKILKTQKVFFGYEPASEETRPSYLESLLPN